MAGFNFGDCYRAAGLQVSAEIIERRVKAFEALRKDADASQVTDLVRLYFGLPVPGQAEWFRAAFAAEDAAFSLVDNEREAAVLAAGLLEALIEDGDIVAVMAPLTTAMLGQRIPKVRAEIIKIAAHRLLLLAKNSRQASTLDGNAIKNPIKSTATDAKNLGEVADLPKLTAIVKQVSDESASWTKALAVQVSGIVRPLISQVGSLQEEVEILWWHIGGYSRRLNKPFIELDVGVACLMAGIDMAELSRGETAPVAAEALLARTLSAVKKPKGGKISLSAAVDAMPKDALEALDFDDAIKTHVDLLPISTALMRAAENGQGAWQAGFKKTTGLDANVSFQPVDLALQMTRERLLSLTLS